MFPAWFVFPGFLIFEKHSQEIMFLCFSDFAKHILQVENVKQFTK